MEKTRTGVIGNLIDFINSFRNSASINDGRVKAEDLDKEDKKELARVLKAGGENVKKIEDSMSKYKEKVDTSKAIKAATRNNEVVVDKDKTIGNR